MATNLRLRPEAEVALKVEAERSGRSQQELIREALDRYLGAEGVLGAADVFGAAEPGEPAGLDDLARRGVVLMPTERLRRPRRRLLLAADESSLDLLDRDDRL